MDTSNTKEINTLTNTASTTTQGTTKYKRYNPDLAIETGYLTSPTLFRDGK